MPVALDQGNKGGLGESDLWCFPASYIRKIVDVAMTFFTTQNHILKFSTKTRIQVLATPTSRYSGGSAHVTG